MQVQSMEHILSLIHLRMERTIILIGRGKPASVCRVYATKIGNLLIFSQAIQDRYTIAVYSKTPSSFRNWEGFVKVYKSCYFFNRKKNLYYLCRLLDTWGLSIPSSEKSLNTIPRQWASQCITKILQQKAKFCSCFDRALLWHIKAEVSAALLLQTQRDG